MDPCEAHENWDSSDHLATLDSLIQDALAEWGFDNVSVVNSPVDGAPGEYDSGIIYLDLSNEAFDDPQDAMSIAYHEAMHAIADQAGLSGTGFDQEWQAGFLGSRAADEALEGCKCGEPAESSGGGNAPPFPWRCDLDDNFEF